MSTQPKLSIPNLVLSISKAQACIHCTYCLPLNRKRTEQRKQKSLKQLQDIGSYFQNLVSAQRRRSQLFLDKRYQDNQQLWHLFCTIFSKEFKQTIKNRKTHLPIALNTDTHTCARTHTQDSHTLRVNFIKSIVTLPKSGE